MGKQNKSPSASKVNRAESIEQYYLNKNDFTTLNS